MAVAPLTAQSLVADGCWTWFNDARAIYADGSTYIGWINASGDVGVTKFDHESESASSFTLKANLEIDDHDNPALYMRADSKLLAAYSKHSGDSVTRVRVASTAGSVAAWGTEQSLTNSESVCYANLNKLSSIGKLDCEFRSGIGAERPRKRWASTDDGSTWGAASTWISQAGQRPYTKSCSNGVDRIDFIVTTGHPNESASSVYHAYMQLDAGVEKFYKSDGTLIGTSMGPSDGTTVYDGSTVDGWVWDITYGADGHPRVLFARYPTTSDHRYMFARWTGSAWTTPVEIVAGGTYLYAAEANYSAGMCFDGNDPTRVYVSAQVSGQWEIQEWRTTDNGATWAKHRDITSGSAVKNCRPWSPRGHDGKIAVLWWRGTYTSYTNYSTAIWGAG